MKLICLPNSPVKPPEFEPCNGCGMCCANEVCSLGKDIAGFTEAPCPAMELEDGRFWCGLARNASKYLGTPAFGDPVISALVIKLLGIGMGCDSTDGRSF